MSSRTLGHVSLWVGVVAFSTSGVLAKLCTAGAVAVAFWVRVFSLGYLAAALLLRRRGAALGRVRAVGRYGVLGGVFFGLHVLLYFWSLELTSVTVVFLMSALDPAVVALFAWAVLGERLRAGQVFWTAVAIAAAAVLALARDATGEVRLAGNLVAAASSLLYCFYFLVSREARRSVGATEYMTGVTLVALLLIGLVAVATGADLGIPSPRDLVLVALLAFGPATVGHLSVSWALRHVEAYAASVVLLAVPVLASLWAALFVGERVGPLQLAAGAVILAAIPGAIRGERVEALEVPAGASGSVPIGPVESEPDRAAGQLVPRPSRRAR